MNKTSQFIITTITLMLKTIPHENTLTTVQLTWYAPEVLTEHNMYNQKDEGGHTWE
jgi:hypothetical protein